MSDNRHGQRWTSADTHGRSAAGHACCDAGSPGRDLASERKASGSARAARDSAIPVVRSAAELSRNRSRRRAARAAGPAPTPGSALGGPPAHAGPHVAKAAQINTAHTPAQNPGAAHSRLPPSPGNECRVVRAPTAASSPGSMPCSRKTAQQPVPARCYPASSPASAGRPAAASRSTPSPWRSGRRAGALLLLVAQRGGGLEILPVDRGFLLPAHLRDLLGKVVQVGSQAHPAFDSGQAAVQRVDPRESVSSEPGRRPASHAGNPHRPHPRPVPRAAAGSPAGGPGSGRRPAPPAPARPRRRPRGSGRAGCARCRCSCGRGARGFPIRQFQYLLGPRRERDVPGRRLLGPGR